MQKRITDNQLVFQTQTPRTCMCMSLRYSIDRIYIQPRPFARSLAQLASPSDGRPVGHSIRTTLCLHHWNPACLYTIYARTHKYIHTRYWRAHAREEMRSVAMSIRGHLRSEMATAAICLTPSGRGACTRRRQLVSMEGICRPRSRRKRPTCTPKYSSNHLFSIVCLKT